VRFPLRKSQGKSPVPNPVGVSIYTLHRTLCVAPSAHAGNHRHASDGARHMPAGDSTTVTIICETISGNESCTACAGSGSETSKIDPISQVIQSVRFPEWDTSENHSHFTPCIGVLCRFRELAQIPWPLRIREQRGREPRKLSSAINVCDEFPPSRSGFFLRPCVKRVSRETQKN